MDKKAVVLLSGGLDSTLAAKLMIEEGVDLVGLYLSAPWGCCDKTKAMKVAVQLGIEFMVVKMTQEYIQVIRNPKYGYGANMNPCVDCRIYMFGKAKEFMSQVGASFIVTGEVLGQRPMSQMRRALHLIERDAGLDRLVVRPLSAKVLPVTVPEELGVINRKHLLGITGRSRKVQMELAVRYGIIDYPNPAGGCLLTEREFSNRVRDLFQHQDRIDLEDMELLRLGRHFRVSPQTKLIVGRNEEENATLAEYLAPGRLLFVPEGFAGPSVLLQGSPERDGTRKLALALISRYTKTEKVTQDGTVICKVGLPREDERSTPLAESMRLNDAIDIEDVELEKMRI